MLNIFQLKNKDERTSFRYIESITDICDSFLPSFSLKNNCNSELSELSGLNELSIVSFSVRNALDAVEVVPSELLLSSVSDKEEDAEDSEVTGTVVDAKFFKSSNFDFEITSKNSARFLCLQFFRIFNNVFTLLISELKCFGVFMS